MTMTCAVCGKKNARVDPETKRCQRADGSPPRTCLPLIGGHGWRLAMSKEGRRILRDRAKARAAA